MIRLEWTFVGENNGTIILMSDGINHNTFMVSNEEHGLIIKDFNMDQLLRFYKGLTEFVKIHAPQID